MLLRHQIVKICLIVIGANLVQAAYSSDQTLLKESLLGAWEVTSNYDTGVTYKELYSFYEDNSFTLSIIRHDVDDIRRYEIRGKYVLHDSYIDYEITESNHPTVLVGATDRNRIVDITTSPVITEGSDGRVTIAIRK